MIYLEVFRPLHGEILADAETASGFNQAFEEASETVRSSARRYDAVTAVAVSASRAPSSKYTHAAEAISTVATPCRNACAGILGESAAGVIATLGGHSSAGSSKQTVAANRSYPRGCIGV